MVAPVGLGGRPVSRPSDGSIVTELSPRLSGFRPGVNHGGIAIEKRAGGHLFQLNVSDSFATTMGQLARGGRRATTGTSGSTSPGHSIEVLERRVARDLPSSRQLRRPVIISFRGRRTADCAARKRVKALSGVERLAWLKLDQLGAADTLGDVTALQSDGLETVNCDGHGPYAIRINEQWRICFEWPETSSGPMNVELVRAHSGGHMAPVTIHPGEHLAEALGALNMSATELARQINVPVNRVTGILNGRRAITGDTALRLAHFFGTSAEFWLNLQSVHELRVAEAKTGRMIQQLPTLRT
jgi:addiction module HigA family antidote